MKTFLAIIFSLCSNCFYYNIEDKIITDKSIEIKFINNTSFTYWVFPSIYVSNNFQITKNDTLIEGLSSPVTHHSNDKLGNEIQEYCSSLSDTQIKKTMLKYSINNLDACVFLFFMDKHIEIKSHNKKLIKFDFYQNSLYSCYKLNSGNRNKYFIEGSNHKLINFKFPKSYLDSLERKNIKIFQNDISTTKIPLNIYKFFTTKNDLFCQ